MAIKISGDTIIDDSRVIVNADKIGIGTTNPTYGLEIFSSSTPTGIALSATSTQSDDTNKAISVFNNSSTNNFSVSYRGRVDAEEYYGTFKGTIDSGVTISTDKIQKLDTKAQVVDSGSDGHFLVETDGTERFRITGIGSVGIGEDDPEDLLSIKKSSDTGYDATAIQSGGARLSIFNSDNTLEDTFADIHFKCHSTSSAEARIGMRMPSVNKSELFFITENDNNLEERFLVQSNGNKIVKNGRLNINSTFIDFSGDVSTPQTAAAIFRPADNTLAFSTKNDERLRITSDGDVGIGTDNPTGSNALTGNNAKLAVGIVTANEVFGTFRGDLVGTVNGLANVKDFGAKGDGTTDDYAAIQSAINSAKTVFFPAGTYKVGAALTVWESNSALIGHESLPTIKVVGTGYSGPPVSVQHSSNNINEFSRIENLKFLFDYNGGGPAPYSSTPNETNCGVSINGSLAPTASATNRVLRFKMENCRVLGFSNGINLKETTNTLIRRVVIEHEFDQSSLSLSSSNIYCGVNFDCTPGQVGGISPQASVELHQVIVNVGGAPENTKSMGFRITGQDPRDIFFEGCETAHGNYGWFIDTSGDDYNIDVHINRPIIDAVDTTGIYVKDWLGYGALTINGGYVVKDANNSGAGIWVENSRGVNITGGIQVLGVSLNNVANDDGIRIKNSKICSVSSSTIMNCRYGISLEDSSNCSVTGNIVGAEIGAFTGGTNPVLSDAIRVFGNSDTNTITGNTIKGASSTYKYSNGILINASTCEENMISSNVIDDSTVTERLKDSGTRTNIFDVGRVAISTETGGKLLLGGGTGSALHFNDSSTRLEITAANNLSVFTSSVEGIRIDQNRDVGIGTTAPRDPVTNTNTSLLAVGIVTANTIFGNLEGDITGELTGKASKVDIANDGDNRIITATGSDTLNAEQNLTFDGSKLLLGTVNAGTDAQILTLYRANTSALEIRTNTSGNSTIHFTDGDPPSGNASYRGYIEYKHDDDDMRFATSSSERLRITGIGTLISTISSPDPFNTVNTNLHLVNTAGNQGAGSRIDFTAGNGKAHIQSQVTGANSNSGTALVFATSPDANGAEERLRITGIGSVGINETSPASTLVVRKDNQGGRGGELSIVNYAGGGSNGIGNEAALNFGLENSTYHADKGNAQIKAVTTAATNATDIVISNYSGSSFEEKLRITSDGKVGINTASNINGRLHVQHVALAENILYATRYNDLTNDKPILAITESQMTGMSSPGLIIGNHNRDIHIGPVFNSSATVDTSDATGIRITSDGKLLIGVTASTSSNSNLQVFKKTGNESTIVIGNVATSADGLCRVDFCPSNKTVGARIECHATEDFSSSENRTADLVFVTRKDGANSEKLRITSDGEVGIGTSDPSSLMHLLAENDRACVRLHNTADTPDNVWELQPAISGESNTGFSIRDVTDSTDRFVIDGSGNVGIGTNNPTGAQALTGNTAILAVGTLKADSISGTVSGTITNATNATTADNIKLTNNASDTECFLVFAQAATNAQLPHTNANLKFNSETGKLLLGANLEVNDGINVTSGVSTFMNQIIAKQDGNFVNQSNVAFVVSSSSNTQMRANHFIVNDLPSGKGTYFIQGTEVGVDNDVNIVLQWYGGKVGIGSTNPNNKLDVIGDVFVSSKVGIGTSNPDVKLHVQESTNETVPLRISTDNSTNKESTIGFENTTGSSSSYHVRCGAVNPGTDFGIFTHDTERLRITSAGFVQIGAASDAAEAPLHVTAENSQGINAIFGAKDFIDSDNYNYPDANIALQGRDADDNDTGAGIQFTVRNTGDSNWLHGAITMDQSGNYIFKNGGAGETVGTEKLRISSDGDLLRGGTSQDIGASNAKWDNIYANKVYADIEGTVTGTASQVSITDGENNRVIMAASTNTLKASADLTFDGTNLFAGGKVLVDHNASVGSGKLQVFTKTKDAIDILSFDDTAADGGRLTFYRNRNTAYDSDTKVQENDSLGVIDFRGMNTEGSANYEIGASIRAEVDGTPGSDGSETDASDMPGRLIFLTTPDGSDSPEERLRITSAGQVQINRDGGSAALTLGESQDFKLYHDANGPTIFSDANNQGLKLQIKELNLTEYTGATTRLKIDTTGRVLIGVDASTNNDSYLQAFKPTGNEATITVGNVATSASGLCRYDFAPSNKVVGARIECHATEDFSTNANRTADLAFLTRKDGTIREKVRISANGDVGIGTNNPTGTDALTNNNTTLAVGKLKANNLEGTYVVPGETGQVFFNNSDVLTAASVLYWDEPNDRLGIGSVIPTQTLDIMSANPVIRLTDTDPAGVYSQIDGAGGDLILAADGGGGSSDSFISFRTDGTALSAEKVRIDSDGHLLVSTTKLSSQNGSIQAAGPILCKSYINDHTSNATVMQYHNGISRIRAYGATVGSGILAFNSGGGGNSLDYERLRITGIGSVGIGATNPNSLLEVRGDAGTYTDGVTVFTGNTTHSGSNAKNGVSLFSFGDALKGGLSSNLLYRNSSTPIQSYSSRSSGKIEIQNTTAANKTSQIIFGGYYKGTTDFVETVRITSDGDVGIGTDNPTGSNATEGNNATLAVGTLKADTIEGDITGELTGKASKVDIANDGNNRIITATGSDTLNAEQNLTFDGSTLALAGDMQFTAANPELEFNNGGPRFRVPSSNTLTIHTGGTLGSTDNEVLRIDSDGKVGINSTIPTAKLDIVEATSIAAVKIKSGTSTNQNASLTFSNDNGGGLMHLGVFGSGATTFGANEATDGFITAMQQLSINSQNDSGEIRFGIGSTPNTKLRITSTGHVRQVWGNELFFGAYYSSEYYMGFTYGTDARELYIDNRSNDTRADIVFRTKEGGAPEERLRIDSTGKIGFGDFSSGTSLLYPIHLKNVMTSSPSFIHMQVTGSNTVGGGGGIAFDTSASSTDSNNSKYLATIAGIRNSADNGSNDLVFSTTKGGQNSNLPEEKLRITDSGAIAFNGESNYGTPGQILKSNGDAPPTWVNSSTISSVDVKQYKVGTTERSCDNPITVSSGTIGITSASNAFGARYISTEASSGTYCDGDIWYDTTGSETIQDTDVVEANKFFQNPTSLTETTTFPLSGSKNGGVFGPYTIANGVTLTINSGSTFTIL